MLEEVMLDNYFLLVRRIPGINLSPQSYWELDTYTTSHLLKCEKEIMKKEEEEYNKHNKNKVGNTSQRTNSEEMEEVMEDLQEEE